MSDLKSALKTIVLAGIGGMAITVEESGKAIDTLVQKGKLTVEQGKIVNEELRRNVSERMKAAASEEEEKESVEDIAARAGRLTPEERALLRKKLDEADAAPADKETAAQGETGSEQAPQQNDGQ